MMASALHPILLILAAALHLGRCHSPVEWAACLSSQCKVELSPDVSMRYKIQLPEGYDLDSHHHDEDECMGCKISVQLLYDGFGWLGIGVSPNGQMVGSHAVIGQPGISSPKAYYMGQKDKNEFAPSQANIEDGNIEFVDGQTVMDFTIQFSEWGYFGGDKSLRLSLVNPSTFIYAHGSNGDAELKYHGPKNKLSHTINGLLSSEESMNSMTFQEHVTSTKSAWLAHGIMAFIAWGVFAPLAVTSAIMRDCNMPSFCKGLASRLSKSWMYIHVGLNTAAYVFTLTVFSLAVSNISREHDSHWEHGHSKMGLAIFLLASFQILGGYFRPANVKSSASETKNSEENDESGINNEDSIGETNVKSMKSMPRQIWELLHPLLGLALFLFGVWQMYAGIELYNQRYHDSAGSTAVSACYICWMGLWTGIITGGFIYKSFFQSRGLGSDVGESAKEQPQDAVDDAKDFI